MKTKQTVTLLVTIGVSILPSDVYSLPKGKLTAHNADSVVGETISLFDGETLNGWVTLDDKPVTRGWDVVDGAIHVKIEKERSGYIKTTRTFENFVLEFEWRVAKGGNSGVKYLAKESDSDRGRAYYGCEYQLLDDKRHKNGRTPTKTAGSLYDLYAPDKEQRRLKPLGEFNHARIVVNNGRIEHWLNGRRIVEATIGSEDWQTRFRKSKVSTVKDFAVGPGVILLQELTDRMMHELRETGDLRVIPDGSTFDRKPFVDPSFVPPTKAEMGSEVLTSPRDDD
jgi:hypothetical protein